MNPAIHAGYLAFIIALLISAMVSIGLIFWLWRLRSAPGAYGLMIALACVAEWSIAYALEIGLIDLSAKIFWAKMQFIGISFVAYGLFVFGLAFSGRGKWLTTNRLAWLSLPGFISIVLVFSNELHHQIWTDIAFSNGQPFGPLNLTHAATFYLVTAYIYILSLTTSFFLYQIATHSQNLHQRQAQIMLAGTLIPWVANLMYLTGLNPLYPLDPTPITFALTNLAISVAFLRYRFMDILPVAHFAVITAMDDGVLVLDSQERVVDINPAGQSILGQGAAILGQNIRTIFADWEGWLAKTPDKTISQEIDLGAGENRHSYNLHITPLLDQRGHPGGKVLLLSDITELKLANAQMREASRMKTQLLANVSHDLRTPLGAVIGYAEMLQTGAFGPVNQEQSEASSEILDSANQLLTFVNNLIGQAQIDSGRVVLRNRPFAPHEITAPILSTINFHANKKGLELTQTIDPNLPEQIVGDIYWLRQIVMNLVNNAVKFTENGSVTVSFLRLSTDRWAIKVADTGIGIPAEAQHSVFEAFEQVDNSDSRKHSGSGLGLAIVKELASLMDGNIELQSEVAQGSTFTVILPLNLIEEEIQ
jgi:signal transduction histidine kinase